MYQVPALSVSIAPAGPPVHVPQVSHVAPKSELLAILLVALTVPAIKTVPLPLAPIAPTKVSPWVIAVHVAPPLVERTSVVTEELLDVATHELPPTYRTVLYE